MSTTRIASLGMGVLLLVAALAYAPGLRGGFLFDDFVNLDALGATGPIDDWPTFLRYLTSGGADPTGRPLSLLSFLLDARDWPAEPFPFLRTNLLLHLINGGLLFALLRTLGWRLDGDTPRTQFAAVLAAGIWVLHPLFVSTTLYVVQREAMLPATFVLLGLLCYLRGDQALQVGRARAGAAWMIAGIAGGTVLATLCKANGLLLPALAMAIDATVLRAAAGPGMRPGRSLRLSLLLLPTLCLLSFLALRLGNLSDVVAYRGWTVGQRLLTEPRVIVDYLGLLFVPRSMSTGLYNDAYVLSATPWQPLSTLPCLLLVALAPVLAWWSRRRNPALSAAVLFYAAGQLLESTVIPLELYFEHRNYVPALLLFWPLARALSKLPWTPRVRAGLAAGIVLLLAATTFQRASDWGDPELLARLWARENPQSPRAQATLATVEAKAGRLPQALARLDQQWRQRPHELQLALNYVNLACAGPGLSRDDSERLQRALSHTRYGFSMVPAWLGNAVDVAEARSCPGVDLDGVEAWLEALAGNRLPGGPAVGADAVETLRARLALARQDPDQALRHLDRAVTAWATPETAAAQVAMLAERGYFRQALAHLDFFEALPPRQIRPRAGMPWLHERVLERQGYWPGELAILRARLLAELAKSPR